MELKIYNQQGVLKATISPSESDRHVKEVMNDNILNLSFILYEPMELGVNDYVDFDGERFTLLEDYKPEQKSTVEYAYNCKFYGIESELKKAKVLKLVDNENELSFSYDATAAEHLQLICDNINRVKEAKNWIIGEVVSSSNVNIEYDNIFCFDALSKIATSFNTEWWIEGTTINLSRCEHGASIPLGYGKGLLWLSRVKNDTVSFFTRLYPLGSTRNIVASDYGHRRLQLPGSVRYVERNTHLGIVEQAEEKAFSHIFPRRTGIVSGVRTEEATGSDGNAFTIYYFTDNGLNFDPNTYEIEGLVKQVSFQKGELNGRDFEVNFNSETKEFEIITQFPYENQQMPGGLLIPKPGDEYILWNIRMPKEYYPLAEKEFEESVQKYIESTSIDTSIYKASTDYIYFDEKGIDLKLGRRVLLENKIYFPTGTHESRVTKISRRLNNITDMDIECTYAVDYGRINQIETSIVNIQAAYKEQLNKDVMTVLKSWDNQDPTDYSLMTALRVVKEIERRALLKERADRTPYSLEVGEDLTIGHLLKALTRLEVGEAVDSLLAGKGIIAENGRIQADRMELRSSLTVLRLIINEIQAMAGDYSFSDCGYIERVDKIDDTTYKLWMEKRTDTDWTNLGEHDVLLSIVNRLLTGGTDYYSSWFRCVSKNRNENSLTVVLYPDSEVPGGKNYPPVAGYNVTRKGNAVMPEAGETNERAQSWLISSREGRIMFLQNVFKPILEDYNYAISIGRFPSVKMIRKLPISPTDVGIMAKTIVAENFYQADWNGDIIPKKVDRGEWSLAVAQGESPYRNVSHEVTLENQSVVTQLEQHTVYHYGCKWGCVIDKTTDEPKWNAPGWILLEGDKNYHLDFTSTNGWQFFHRSLDTVVSAVVSYGNRDITDVLMASDGVQVEWLRNTGNVPADNAWQPTYVDGKKHVIHLTRSDMGSEWGVSVRKVRFVCRVFIPIGGGKFEKTENYIGFKA